MIVYDVASNVLDIRGITFIVLFCFGQEKPFRWKKIHTHTHTRAHTHTHAHTPTHPHTHIHKGREYAKVIHGSA